MNKTRALMDSLMGTDRNATKDQRGDATDRFKDGQFCKPYLVGVCPLDPLLLGGRRNFQSCEKIHSDAMKKQFEDHHDFRYLKRRYEGDAYRVLEWVIRECDKKVKVEQGRIKEEAFHENAPSIGEIAEIDNLRQEIASLVKRAEDVDDTRLIYKQKLMDQVKAKEVQLKTLDDEKAQKASESTETEGLCEVCASTYRGAAAEEAHKEFKIHLAYVKLRKQYEDMADRADEFLNNKSVSRSRTRKRAESRSGRRGREDTGRQDGGRDDRSWRDDRRRDDRSRSRGGRGRDNQGRDDRGREDRGRDDRGRDDRGRDDRGREDRGRDDRSRDDRGRDDRGRGDYRDDKGKGKGNEFGGLSAYEISMQLMKRAKERAAKGKVGEKGKVADGKGKCK